MGIPGRTWAVHRWDAAWRWGVLLCGIRLLTANLDAETVDTGFLSPQAVARKVILPLYAKGEAEPAIVVRASRVSREFQRHGFFRLGLAPQTVMIDLSIEVRDAPRARELLRDVVSRVSSESGKGPVLVRGIAICLPGQSAPVVKASGLDFASGVWRLRAGTLTLSGKDSTEFSDAILNVTGPNVGRLTLAADVGPRVIDLFEITPSHLSLKSLP